MAAKKALQNLRISEHLYGLAGNTQILKGDKWGVLRVMMQ